MSSYSPLSRICEPTGIILRVPRYVDSKRLAEIQAQFAALGKLNGYTLIFSEIEKSPNEERNFRVCSAKSSD